MPIDPAQAEIAIEAWETLYKNEEACPTIIVKQIMEYWDDKNRETLARLQAELDGVQVLAAEQASKIRDINKTGNLPADDTSKTTKNGGRGKQVGSTASKLGPKGPPKETWDATINNIGATIHLTNADELYQKRDIEGLVGVAEKAVVCAEKQLDKKLLAEAWIWLGTGYSSKHNLKSGLQAFQRAIEIIQPLDQKDKDVERMKNLILTWQSDIKEPEARFSAELRRIEAK